MKLIDADRLLDRCIFYHLPNGDLAVPIIDVQHAPTVEAPDTNVGNMDAISRQAVKDIFTELYGISAIGSVFDKYEWADICETTANELPSVQPDTTTHDSIPAKTGENDGDRTSGDCISRQQAIDTLLGITAMRNTIPLDSAIFNIKKLPSIQPERKTGRWIPVSERLPDDLAEVNVTWINHKPEPYYDFTKDKPFTASAVYYKGDWYWYSSVCADLLAEYGKNEIDEIDGAIEITAWMPLPEPYQEGDIE